MPLFNRVALFGVGLIGGSLALDARREGLFGHVTASSRRPESLETALKRGIADSTTLDPAECVRGADLVVLAVPVAATEAIVKSIAPELKPEAVLTDVGSVKGIMVEIIEKILPDSSRFVPGHPVAGSENFGPESAFEGLFAGKRFIITPTSRTDREALDKVKKLWEGVGMKVSEMDPYRHDKILAATSHLPHLVAYSLVETVVKLAETDPDVLDFNAGGLHDFTRVAVSSPDMWRDIFLMNSSSLNEVLDLFLSAINELKKIIKENDGDELWNKLEQARRFKEKKN